LFQNRLRKWLKKSPENRKSKETPKKTDKKSIERWRIEFSFLNLQTEKKMIVFFSLNTIVYFPQSFNNKQI